MAWQSSHSTRVRGLKYKAKTKEWIENKSHSTRVRGLKLICLDKEANRNTSHSTRVRGLKSSSCLSTDNLYKVALYTSAWIEITTWHAPSLQTTVALYTSAWIEFSHADCIHMMDLVALYTSAWIEMRSQTGSLSKTRSRTLHECVD